MVALSKLRENFSQPIQGRIDSILKNTGTSSESWLLWRPMYDKSFILYKPFPEDSISDFVEKSDGGSEDSMILSNIVVNSGREVKSSRLYISTWPSARLSISVSCCSTRDDV